MRTLKRSGRNLIMLKSKVASIIWTERFIYNAISIKGYLISNFSSKEVDHFNATNNIK